MTRQSIEVQLAGFRSLLRGYGSRDLAEEVSGRPPAYFRAERGWSVTERVARDCIAAAEARGWDVVVIGPRQASLLGITEADRQPITSRSRHEPELQPAADSRKYSEQPDPGQGLW